MLRICFVRFFVNFRLNLYVISGNIHLPCRAKRSKLKQWLIKLWCQGAKLIKQLTTHVSTGSVTAHETRLPAAHNCNSQWNEFHSTLQAISVSIEVSSLAPYKVTDLGVKQAPKTSRDKQNALKTN